MLKQSLKRLADQRQPHLVLAIVLIGCTAVGCTSQHDADIQQLSVTRARVAEALKHNDYIVAESQLKQGLVLAQRSADAMSAAHIEEELGDLCLQAERPEEAETYYAGAVEMYGALPSQSENDPALQTDIIENKLRARVKLADSFGKQKKFREAENQYTDVLKECDRNVHISHSLRRSALDGYKKLMEAQGKTNTARAVTSILSAETEIPDSPQQSLNAGLSYLDRGNTSQAKNEFERGLQPIDNGQKSSALQFEVIDMLAITDLMDQNPAAAISDLQKSSSQRTPSQKAAALAIEAWALSLMNKDHDSRGRLEKLRQLPLEDMYHLPFRRIQTAYESKKKVAELLRFERWVMTNKNVFSTASTRDACSFYFWAACKSKDERERKQYYELAHEWMLKDDSVEPMMMAGVLSACGTPNDFDRAIAVYKKAVEMGDSTLIPPLVTVLMQKSALQQQQNHLAEAETLLKQVLEYAQQEKAAGRALHIFNALYALGTMKMSENKNKDALEFYANALKVGAGDGVINGLLADAASRCSLCASNLADTKLRDQYFQQCMALSKGDPVRLEQYDLWYAVTIRTEDPKAAQHYLKLALEEGDRLEKTQPQQKCLAFVQGSLVLRDADRGKALALLDQGHQWIKEHKALYTDYEPEMLFQKAYISQRSNDKAKTETLYKQTIMQVRPTPALYASRHMVFLYYGAWLQESGRRKDALNAFKNSLSSSKTPGERAESEGKIKALGA